MTNRAAIYLRSSKDRSDVSIDAQRRALHELAVTRGLCVVDEFVDAVESGKDDDRPGFQRLLHALKDQARGWEHVLVLDTSRVARNVMVAQLFEKECAKHRIGLLYKSLPDLDPITGTLIKTFLQGIDQWHSLISKQKGLAGMAENVRQGWRAGGRAPRGYQLVYTATGAIRDGEPVTKSRLELDHACSSMVGSYLKLRAEGVSRGVAIARLKLPWLASSLHSMDWQALTYAGHTVWNMHAEGGSDEKRRPREEWIVKRNTHPALIADAEAEAILGQVMRGQQGRRMRASPLLLTGLLSAPDGTRWHSDGSGSYRLGKGKKVSAARLEADVLDHIGNDLMAETTVQRVLKTISEIDQPRTDGRILAGMEKRIDALTVQIGRTVDLASEMEDPQPVLRRVHELEQQRATLMTDLAEKREANAHRNDAARITPAQVRSLLKRFFTEIVSDESTREQGRLALNELVEKIELDPTSLTCRVHYALSAGGDNLASPRGFEPLYSP